MKTALTSNAKQTASDATLEKTLLTLDALLARYQPLWQANEFSTNGISMAEKRIADYPTVDKALAALSLADVEQLDAAPLEHLAWMRALLPGFCGLPKALTDSLELTVNSNASVPCQTRIPFWLETGIGGRKLAQIKQFLAQLPQLKGEAIEWCAGKGHLGRLWLYQQQEQGNDALGVCSIEWQQSLCEQGHQLASQHQLAQQFVAKDVLQEDTSGLFAQADHAVALHACGDLHRRFLELASTHCLEYIALAPCCYHLTAQSEYQPMSAYVRRHSALALNKDDLKLAVQGQVTAGQRTQRLRQQEVIWRLSYQLIREDRLQTPGYRPLPALKKALLSEDFASFFGWATRHHQWDIKCQDEVFNHYIERAEALYLRLKRVDLLRHGFRRVLELWLALDRGIYLKEQGYRVELTTFCHYQQSPRNFMLKARHKKAS